MIRARDVTKRYGRTTVLAGVDFEVERGEWVALVGANGAGKTTLFRCLLGLVDFDGELTVDGEPAGVAGSAARSRLAYVPQSPPLFDLSLTGFVGFFAALREVDVAPIERRLAALGLDPETHGGKSMKALSGGMLQKAYLALALGSGAPVLLLDEPTASLDRRSRAQFLAHLSGVDRDVSVIFATHRVEEIEALATRVIAIETGRIAYDGPLRRFLREGPTTLLRELDAGPSVVVGAVEGSR